MGFSLSSHYICQVLRQKGLLSANQLKTVLGREDDEKKRLERIYQKEIEQLKKGRIRHGVTIVDVIAALKLKLPKNPKHILDEELIMRTVAEEMGMSFKKIDPLELDLDIVTKTIPENFALHHLVIPINLSNGRLEVVVYDPTDKEVLEDIKRVTGYEVFPYLGTKTDILKTVREFFGFKSSIVAAESKLDQPGVDLGNLEQYVRLKKEEDISSADHHIKKAVDYLFDYAFEQRASDIHIEPKREYSVVRLRIDGFLHPIYRLPKIVHSAVVSRIKTLSRLNIAEKRRPQDGRIKIEWKDKDAEIRVSTIPVAFGEKAVLRILNPDILFQDLGQLGFRKEDLGTYKEITGYPYGLVLVTGPTGSGKSTTLYSTLRYLNTAHNNIVTIEDPVEMVYEPFNQIAVQPVIGITFANILRHILRQDPDIIMVGEIRDRETVENAIQAALTGHLVLSTLHTNDASSSITRLLDLGIKPFLIANTLIEVVAQRLVRKICPHCQEDFWLKAEDLKSIGILVEGHQTVKLKRGKGCVQCRETGYLGRIGVFELLSISDSIKHVIHQGGDEDSLKTQAQKQGMTTLRYGAIQKMLEGITTYEEVIRVVGSTT